ncbi:MAG: hypothetical protein Tsb009_28170 [Planctomycetaceae bacterium]
MAPLTQLNLQATKESARFEHDRQLVCCRVSHDLKFLFAAGFDGKLHRWDLKTRQHTEAAAPGGWIESMVLHPRRPELFTADSWGNLRCWSADKPALKPRWSIEKAHTSWLRDLAISPDGRILASSGNDHKVRLFAAENGRPIREFTGHDSHVQSVVFSPDGKHLVSGDLHGVVRQWDLKTGRAIRTFDASMLYKKIREYDQGGARAMTFDTSGKSLYVGGIEGTVPNQSHGNPTVIAFDWASGKQTTVHTTKASYKGPIIDLAFHPAGYLIGSGSSEAGGRLWFWKAGEAKDVHFIKHRTSFRGIGLHSVGVHLVATAFGSNSGQRGGNGRRLNKNGEYVGFGGEVVQYTLTDKAGDAKKKK